LDTFSLHSKIYKHDDNKKKKVMNKKKLYSLNAQYKLFIMLDLKLSIRSVSSLWISMANQIVYFLLFAQLDNGVVIIIG
jgi:hypothetical protein